MNMKIVYQYAIVLIAIFFFSISCQGKKESIVVTVNQKGEISVFGKMVSNLESLKAVLIDSLTQMPEIPEKIEINFEGEVGMGLRHEVETLVNEAIEQAKIAQTAPKIEILSFRKEEGADCNKEKEEDRIACATVDLQYPSIVEGEKALQDSVAKWTLAYLVSVLTGGSEEVSENTTLERGVEIFFNTFNSYEDTDIMGPFEAQTGSETVLNNGKYLTLAISGYTFMGGAHGSPTQALNTFDAKTGKILTWNDLVTDTTAFKALVEKKVREIRVNDFEYGFDFDEVFQFVLPSCYGLTKEGLYLFYQHYEIMPYAMGITEVEITFEELGSLSKIKF